jgi:hypothetical protein
MPLGRANSGLAQRGINEQSDPEDSSFRVEM